MYKRRIMFFAVLVLLMTGCTKISNNLDEIVRATMENDNGYVNTVSTGYELYIPTGVKQVIDSEFNQKFRIKDRYVYLYVDTISYYYKNTLNYKSEDNYDYYYKDLQFSGKTGYIGIKRTNDGLLFVESIYNYSKIEFYSDEDNLPVILANALIMQKSIKYNDSLINLELGIDTSEGREIKYELDSPKNAESKFSDYLQEYVPEEDEEVELPDED